MKKFLTLLLALPAALLFADDASTGGSSGGFTQTLLMIGIALVFFYFILWRPEQKRRKKVETQRSSMKKGDRVTAMGIIGTLSSIKENTVIIKMYDGAKLEFLKAAVTEVQPANNEQAEKETEPAKS